MAFKISKAEKNEMDNIAKALEEQSRLLESAQETYNEALQEAVEDLQKAVENFNEVVEDANKFAAKIAERVSEEIEEKSDRWRESDACGDAEAFQEVFESYEKDLIVVEQPPICEEFDTLEEIVADFHDLPTEAG